MSFPLAVAVGLVRTWVATYTQGLPPVLREARRSEIDADLWEQRWLASRRRDTELGTAIEVLARMLLGIASDITWRLETGASVRAKGHTSVNDKLLMKIGLFIAMTGPIFLTLNGLGFLLLGSGDFDSTWDQLRWGTAIMLASLAIIAGLWLSARAPRIGPPMVALGVIANTIVFHWMAPVFIPIGVAIVIFSALRGGLIRLPSARPHAA